MSQQINKEIIAGESASRGKAEGPIKIIRNEDDMALISLGDVAVFKHATPKLSTVVQKCAAIITEYGGVTSHAAIISREFGIPCIVGVERVAKILKDGDRVEVDANNGKVTLLVS